MTCQGKQDKTSCEELKETIAQKFSIREFVLSIFRNILTVYCP